MIGIPIIRFIKAVAIWIFNFFKKNGIFAFFAVATLYIPLWLGYVLNDTEMIAFGWKWVAIWAAPFPPAFLVLALLVAFYRWMWQLARQGVIFFKETMQKLQTQNQLMAYLTSEEIKMILEMAKRVDAESDSRLVAYKEVLRKERLEMIDDKWTQTCANYELTEEDEE